MNEAFSSLSSKQFRHHEPVILTEQYSCEYKWKHCLQHSPNHVPMPTYHFGGKVDVHRISNFKYPTCNVRRISHPDLNCHCPSLFPHERNMLFRCLEHNAICILSCIFSNTPNNNDFSWIDATNVWWRVQKTGTAHCPNASSRVSSAEWEFCSRQTLHASRVRCERNIHYWRYVGNIIHKAILLSKWSTYKYDQGNATNNGTGLG